MAPSCTTTVAFIGAVPCIPVVLPLYGQRICAGFPSPADDFQDGELDLLRLIAPNPHACFFWWVEGTSMVESGIYDGDLIVVDRSAPLEDGCAVVAVIDGETSLKVYRIKPYPHLEFANANFPVLVVDDAQDVTIWGKVTFNLHRPRKR